MVDGEVAYGIYYRALAEQGVQASPWYELDETDQNAWQAVADQLWRATTE